MENIYKCFEDVISSLNKYAQAAGQETMICLCCFEPKSVIDDFDHSDDTVCNACESESVLAKVEFEKQISSVSQ